MSWVPFIQLSSQFDVIPRLGSDALVFCRFHSLVSDPYFTGAPGAEYLFFVDLSILFRVVGYLGRKLR